MSVHRTDACASSRRPHEEAGEVSSAGMGRGARLLLSF